MPGDHTDSDIASHDLDRHKHEIDSGRTSSVGMEILGFDAKSVPVPTMSHGRNAPWDEICGKAAKVINDVELCAQCAQLTGFMMS